MPFHKGRDLLLTISDGGSPEIFTAIGAARTTSLVLGNAPVEATSMDSGGVQRLVSGAGVQRMRVRLDGLFRDDAAEALLRAVAFSGASRRYRLVFPNGDSYEAAFIVQDYARGGTHDGLESFSATLLRDGAGIFTAG